MTRDIELATRYLELADADMAAVSEGLAREFPKTNTGRGVILEPLRDAAIGWELRQTSMLFLGVVGSRPARRVATAVALLFGAGLLLRRDPRRSCACLAKRVIEHGMPISRRSSAKTVEAGAEGS